MTPTEAAEFWLFPEAEDEPPPPASEDQIRRFNRDHQIELPESFVILYSQQNGGGTQHLPDPFWSLDDPVCPVSSLVTVGDWTHDEDAKRYWQMTFGDPGRVVVFFGDGHFYFALNYNELKLGEPMVWYITDDNAYSTTRSFEQWIRNHDRSA